MAVTVKVTGGTKYQAFLAKMAQIAGGVKAGIFGNATQAKIGGANIASYAFWNEFGTTIRVTPKMRAYMHYRGVHLKKETTAIKIPARPFMRTVAKSDAPKKWCSAMLAHIKGRANNPAVWKQALGVAGSLMKSNIQDSIMNGNWTPNAPLTVKWKAERGKSQPDKPLFDTGDMYNAITFQVVDKV